MTRRQKHQGKDEFRENLTSNFAIGNIYYLQKDVFPFEN